MSKELQFKIVTSDDGKTVEKFEGDLNLMMELVKNVPTTTETKEESAKADPTVQPKTTFSEAAKNL